MRAAMWSRCDNGFDFRYYFAIISDGLPWSLERPEWKTKANRSGITHFAFDTNSYFPRPKAVPSRSPPRNIHRHTEESESTNLALIFDTEPHGSSRIKNNGINHGNWEDFRIIYSLSLGSDERWSAELLVVGQIAFAIRVSDSGFGFGSGCVYADRPTKSEKSQTARALGELWALMFVDLLV